VARIVAKLKEEGALDYTIIVSATASDTASLQYIAPFAACAIGEYFADKGEDVLVVYDDLTKHAWAYRQLSLLLRKPAGREAYPGTALPIIETQGNDMSAYIPTNVISITDGQIYLEADLFNAGIRPALNVGLSVSRVGGAAQTKPMKQLAGPVRLELSQFRELQSFAQFGSDLDDDTLKKLLRGKVLTEILKQPQYQPYDEVSEVIAIYSATSGCMDDVPVHRVLEIEGKIIDFIKTNYKELVTKISGNKKLDETTLSELKKRIEECKKTVI
jgi:F-type H+-transporting ATPase subunit alpha